MGKVKDEFSTSSILKKIDKDNLKKKHVGKHCSKIKIMWGNTVAKKNNMEKHCNNPKYFLKKTTKQNRQRPF